MKRIFPSFLIVLLATATALASSTKLPDGTEFPVWEKPPHFLKTYYVDGQGKNADDAGLGIKERPFRTIDAAAQVLQPGERVVIAAGVYRECVRPARGGTGSDAIISYEAAPGAKVVIKGSEIVKDWRPGQGWNYGIDPVTKKPVKAWELHLDPALFHGYNPFEVDNVIGNRYWINYAKDNMWIYFRRRRLVFVDGKQLEPVELSTDLAGPSPHRRVMSRASIVAGMANNRSQAVSSATKETI